MSERLVIPAAAIEAAHQRVQHYIDDIDPAEFQDILKMALEAATPHLLAPLLGLADDLEASTLAGDNYMTGRGSGFRIAGVRIRQVLGLGK